VIPDILVLSVRQVAGSALAMILLAAGGCGDDGCLDEVVTDCDVLYPPVYDQIFANTFQPTCGEAGTACHAPEGAHNGLVFADPDEAYGLLLGQEGAPARVLPDQPECSLLRRRLESGDDDFVMPPGMPLSEPERCTIRQWVAAGAPR